MARGRTSDRVALVTLGAGELGRPLVLELARQGYSVVIDGAGPEVRLLADEIAASGRYARTIRGDVSDKVDVASMFASIEQQEGRLDLLLFHSGTHRAPEHDEPTPEDWDELIGRTLTGAFTCCYHARPLLRESRGQVLLVAPPPSRGLYAGPHATAWRVARSGMRELARSLSGVYAPEVRVNLISPGRLGTSDPDQTAVVPLLRPGRTEDVIGAVRYLLEATWVTGVDLEVAGGVRL